MFNGTERAVCKSEITLIVARLPCVEATAEMAQQKVGGAINNHS